MGLLRFARYLESKYFLKHSSAEIASEKAQKFASFMQKKYAATHTYSDWLGDTRSTTSISFPHMRGIDALFCPFIMSENIGLPKEEDNRLRLELNSKVNQIISEFKSEIKGAYAGKLSKKESEEFSKQLHRKLFSNILDGQFTPGMEKCKSLLDLINVIQRNANSVFRLFEIPKGKDGATKFYFVLRRLAGDFSEALDNFSTKIVSQIKNYADKLDLKSIDEDRARKIEVRCIQITDNFLSNFNFEDTNEDNKFKSQFDSLYRELKKSKSMCLSIPYVISFLESIKLPEKLLDNDHFMKIFTKYRDEMEYAVIGKAGPTHFNGDSDPALYRGVISTDDPHFIRSRERAQPPSIGMGGVSESRKNNEISFGNSYALNNTDMNSRDRRPDLKEDALPDLVTEEELRRYPYPSKERIGNMLAEGEKYKRTILDEFSQEMVPIIAKSLDPEVNHRNSMSLYENRARQIFRDGSKNNEIYKIYQGRFILDDKEYPGINNIINDLMIQEGMEYSLRYTVAEWRKIIPRAMSIMKQNYGGIGNQDSMKDHIESVEDLESSNKAKEQIETERKYKEYLRDIERGGQKP